jgi:hypothetical protein
VDFTPQPLDLQLLRLHLTMAGEGMLRVGAQLPDPLAQNILVEIQVTRRLRD